MRYILSVFIILLVTYSIKSQKLDSLGAISNLEAYELSHRASLYEYYDLLDASVYLLPRDKKIEYTKRGLDASEKIASDSLAIGFASSLMLYYLLDDNVNDSVKIYANKLIKVSTNIAYAEAIGAGENGLGTYYQLRKEYQKALEHYDLAINAYTKTEASYRSSVTLSNMSEIYKDFGDVSTAIKYIQYALPYAQKYPENKRKDKVGYCYLKLAEYFDILEERDSVEYYRLKNIELAQQVENSTMNNIKKFSYDSYLFSVDYFLKNNQIDSAQIYLNKAAESKDIWSSKYNMGKLAYCLASKDCNDLEGLFNLVFSNDDIIKDARYYELKKAYYLYNKQDEKALKEEEALRSFQEETYTKERNNYAIFMDSKFELKEKEKQIASLESDNKLKEAQLNIFFLSLAFCFLLLILGLFIYRQIKQSNQLLKVELQNKELVEIQATEAQKNYEAKNHLFGNISHELGTPLTLLKANLNKLLTKSQLNQEDKNLLQVADNACSELMQLNNQILDLTKGQIAETEIRVYICNLHDLLNYLSNQFTPIAERKGLQLRFPDTIEQDFQLKVDVEKLLTILRNLLSNAIKYSKSEGQVSVTYNRSGEYLQISINDNGLGISKEHLPLIFDRYYQIPERRSSEGGLGIGLSICKEYIHLLGGTIEVKSEEGEGTKFTIELPVNYPKYQDESKIIPYQFPIQVSIERRILPKINTETATDYEYLLIVEDNLDLCQYLHDILNDDYNLSFAHNGEEALQQINTLLPKVILTDWMMPVMDGLTLINRLKTNEIFAPIPILMLTARNNAKELVSLMRIGVDNYLTKPFDEEELTAHLEYLIELSESRKKLDSEIFPSSNNNENLDEYDSLYIISEKEKIFLDNIEQIILDNLSDFNFTVGNVASLVNLSSRHLARKIKGLTGLTINKYIQEIRYREAKRMLIEREYLTVKAVTYTVGFKSEKYFSRNFKKRFGKYPKEFLS